jgi:hypothetical protein
MATQNRRWHCLVDGNFLQIWARLKRALVGGALGPIVRMMKVMEEVRLPVCYHTSPVNSLQPAVGAACCWPLLPSQRRQAAQQAIASQGIIVGELDHPKAVAVTKQGNLELYTDVGFEHFFLKFFRGVFASVLRKRLQNFVVQEAIMARQRLMANNNVLQSVKKVSWVVRTYH